MAEQSDECQKSPNLVVLPTFAKRSIKPILAKIREGD